MIYFDNGNGGVYLEPSKVIAMDISGPYYSTAVKLYIEDFKEPITVFGDRYQFEVTEKIEKARKERMLYFTYKDSGVYVDPAKVISMDLSGSYYSKAVKLYIKGYEKPIIAFGDQSKYDVVDKINKARKELGLD